MVALFYHPDGYETSRDHLMGRHAAGEGMLKAVCQFASEDKMHCYCVEKKHFEHFLKKVKAFSSKPKVCTWVHPTNWRQLKEAGTLFMAGPVLSDLAWLRRHGEIYDFSLCGVTHTTATDRAMDAIGNLITAPVYPWDALVCTSHSVRSMVKKVMEDYRAYLADRFSAPVPKPLPVELPVIPLGVDCNSFAISETKRHEIRTQWREKLGIKPTDKVVLYVGRFSFHDKAHPMPMFMALEKSAKALGDPVCFIMAGWFQNDAIKKEFISAAGKFCPSVRVLFVDGRNLQVRKTIWYAADVFTSLSDNVQETFGLTPIEAMAAGLPVVVSDWDGYKETVRDGVDGLRIPTWTAPPGLGLGLAFGYAAGVESYGHYVGYQSQFTSVDISACAQAFQRLLSDEPLRKQMSAAAIARAKSVFDWQNVLRQYEELWSHLDKTRLEAAKSGGTQLGPANPLRNDPFSLFSNYATHLLSPDSAVGKSGLLDGKDVHLDHFMRSQLTSLGTKFTHSNSQMRSLLESLPDNKIVSVQSLCSKVPASEGRALLFSLLWLSKLGVVSLENGDGNALQFSREETTR